jgi:hypothetical protein
MPADTMFGLMLVVITAVYAVSAAVSFFLGERVLREVRARYPEHWANAGSPTYLSLAIMGGKFWRPVSASNYFSRRRYTILGDNDVSRRAETVRTWQMVMNGGMLGLAVVAAIGLLLR